MPGTTPEDVRRCECNSDEEHPHIELGGKPVRGCAFDMPLAEFNELQAVAHSIWWVENGHLPAAGGRDDQAATYVDAIEVLLRLRQEIIESED